jgi:DNA-binding CsgD family transcriptional regulator
MEAALDCFGDAVLQIGGAGFAPALLRAFDENFQIDHFTVFHFDDAGTPKSGVSAAKGAGLKTAEKLAECYMREGFVHDPIRTRLANNHTREIFTFSPGEDRALDPVFRHRFYDEPGLLHEMVLLDASKKQSFYLSLYRRKGQRAFANEDGLRLHMMSRLSLRMVEKHLALSGMETSAQVDIGAERLATLDHLKRVMLQEGHRLTEREAEICASIVLGYSTLAISLNCSISLNTVATHRKRAYAKLGVGSQNELFARYFRTVKRLESGSLMFS